MDGQCPADMELVVLFSCLGAGLAVTSQRTTLNVQVVTWNVNKRHPPEDLAELVNLDRDPDILVIGLQEENCTVDMSKVFEVGLENSEWDTALQRGLPYRGMNPVRSSSFLGLLLMLYIKPEHYETLEDLGHPDGRIYGGTLQTQGPEYGHKAGMWFGVSLLGVKLVFLTAHFTHADGNLERRLEDFHQLEDKSESLSGVDYKFWFGDLNFRLKDQNELTAEKIADRIANGQENELLEKDELRSAMKEGKVFQGYSESEISFKPTYKFELGTSRYDLSRRPAWTDRVLYRAAPGRDITPVYYGSIPHLKASDHKPVEAFFRIPLDAQNSV